MKKLSFLLSLILFSLALTACAQTPEPVTKLNSVDCFSPGLYKFQSVQVSVGPENQSYKAGDTINFIGNVINQNDYPVVDGNVFVRLGKQNPAYIHDGHNTVDEIMPITGLSIDANASLPVTFSWKVPNDLGAGEYRADYFFSVGKKFNLGGLPFTNEIIVGFANFTVTNTKETEFVLDRTATMVNGQKYNHIGQWPILKEGDKVTITQPLKNLSDKDLTFKINYDLFYWDSLNPQDKLDTKTETITVPAKSSKTLTYIIPKTEQVVYYLRLRATSGDASSMVNIRTTADIERARINYPAINNFPLITGESASLFSCFHTVSGVSSSSKLILTLTDKAGNLITKGEYNEDFDSSMNGASGQFTATKDYSYINLKAELYDHGKLADSYETAYDCANLKTPKCATPAVNNTNQLIAIYALVLSLLSFIFLFITTRFVKSPTRRIFTIIFIFLAVVSLTVFFSALMSGGDVPKVVAERISADGKRKSETKTQFYDVRVDVNNWLFTSVIIEGDVGMTYSATLIGSTTLLVGEGVSFTATTSCSFYFTGGYLDSPYCGQTLSHTFGDNLTVAYLNNTNGPTPLSLTSSDTNVMTCSGNTCRAVGTGTVILTKGFGPTTIFVNGRVITYSKNNSPQPKDFSSPPIVLDGYYPTWEITVVPPLVNGSCGPAAAAYPSTAATFSGAFCSAGTSTPASPPFPAIGTTTSWICSGSNGGANSGSCDATRLFPALIASCSVNPTTVTVGQSVTYTATSTGGSGGYYYRWWNKSTMTQYGSGSYNATLSMAPNNDVWAIVYRGSESANVQCPIVIVNPAAPTCSDGIKNQDETSIDFGGVCGNFPPGSGNCSDGIKNGNEASVDSGGRCCSGSIPSGSAACSGTITNNGGTWSSVSSCPATPGNCQYISTGPVLDPSLNCTLFMEPYYSTVNINTNTIWKAKHTDGTSLFSPTSNYVFKWTVNGVTTEGLNPWNKIFTTVGTKNVSVQVLSADRTRSGNSCSGQITTVVQQGGGIQEQ